MAKLTDVLRSIILEANPTIPAAQVGKLVKKYLEAAKWADTD